MFPRAGRSIRSIGCRDGKLVANEKDAEGGVLYFMGEIG
jgi:hypothetical protein